MAELRSIQHCLGSHKRHPKNDGWMGTKFLVQPRELQHWSRVVITQTTINLKFEPSLCHVLARHSVLCVWWSCYCCDMFISFLVTLLLLIQCIPVGLSPVLVAKRDPPLCWASSIFCCFQLLASWRKQNTFCFLNIPFLVVWPFGDQTWLEYPPFQIDFLSSVCFSCDFVSFSPKEASHRKRRQRSRKRSMVWLCAAMWCRTLDGENDSWNQWIWEDHADWFPWFAAKMAMKSWCIYWQNKHIPGCLTRCPISSDIPTRMKNGTLTMK